jgi:hypothetical protein
MLFLKIRRSFYIIGWSQCFEFFSIYIRPKNFVKYIFLLSLMSSIQRCINHWKKKFAQILNFPHLKITRNNESLAIVLSFLYCQWEKAKKNKLCLLKRKKRKRITSSFTFHNIVFQIEQIVKNLKTWQYKHHSTAVLTVRSIDFYFFQMKWNYMTSKLWNK